MRLRIVGKLCLGRNQGAGRCQWQEDWRHVWNLDNILLEIEEDVDKGALEAEPVALEGQWALRVNSGMVHLQEMGGQR